MLSEPTQVRTNSECDYFIFRNQLSIDYLRKHHGNQLVYVQLIILTIELTKSSLVPIVYS